MITALAPRAFPRPLTTTEPEAQDSLSSAEMGTDPGQKAMADPRRVGANEATEETAADREALSPEDQKEVERLKKRDAEVRRHEQAHSSAGGAHAGSPSYSYENGPDGQRYAVDGEVSIDSSIVQGDPSATVAKLEQVVRAAMAPVEPSGQDQKVASAARAKIARARAEMVQVEEDSVDGEGGPSLRAASAYQQLGAASGPGPESTLSIVSCERCGTSHNE